MTHDVQQFGFILRRAVLPLRRLSRATQPPVIDAATQLLLERQRHQAFISTLAHELRQPLSAMFSAVEILRQTRSSSAPGNVVDVIDRQANHMSRLVEDLIESVQSKRGAVRLRTQRLDLRAGIAEALSDAGEAIAARRHRVVTSSTPEPLWVDADPGRFRQVLSNLLDNAIKFTEPGGEIRLSACRAGRDVVVRIADTGCGLRSHELAHIFELFSQVRPGEGRGLGIGLNVAREIVALHQGRIEVRSDGPSRGSEFIVTLPAAAAIGEAS